MCLLVACRVNSGCLAVPLVGVSDEDGIQTCGAAHKKVLKHTLHLIVLAASLDFSCDEGPFLASAKFRARRSAAFAPLPMMIQRPLVVQMHTEIRPI